MALGVFDAAGAVRLQLHREAEVSSAGDLQIYSLEEWDAVVERKGCIRRLWSLPASPNAMVVPSIDRYRAYARCRVSFGGGASAGARQQKGMGVHLDDDAEAIRRCQRGDIGGLEPLICRYQVAAIRLAYLLVGERAAAEDVVQDSFLQAYRGIARFREGSAFTPWFYRIVTNTARQRRATARREITLGWLSGDDELDGGSEVSSLRTELRDRDPLADPALHAERQEEREDILRALAGLTRKQREAVALRYYLGCSDRELAAILGCSEGAARQRLHDGLLALRQIITRRFAWLDVTTPTRPQ